MSRRGWVGWVSENRAAAGGLGIVLVLFLIALGVVASRSGDDDDTTADQAVEAGQESPSTVVLAPGETAPPGQPGAPTETIAGGGPAPTVAAGGTSGSGTGGGATATTVAGGGGGGGAATTTTAASTKCTAKDVKGTGISKTEVRIGQIVSDVSILPAQLKPNHEGLQALVNRVNAEQGGVCGRKIVLDYSNDNSNPATHEYEAMTHRVFAFVANSSLIDQLDYQSDAPFNPNVKDNGEYVPDVGGLAYSYGRNQSPMFAGVVGSLSPSLTGGGQFKFMVNEARTAGKPCKKAGIVYLREPNGSSEDQGRLGGAALGASWGANLGADNVKYYVANLADPVPLYEQMVATMTVDGVNCAFTYMDLGSNINLVKAMGNRGVWPPDKCSAQCFSVVYMPFAGYDPKFIRDVGDAARSVSTFLPHAPLNEANNPGLQKYLSDLKKYGPRDAEPSTFSIIGYASGVMFVEAMERCGGAPTRACLMQQLKSLKDFTAGGLLGGITPFKATAVDCADGCGNFSGRGKYNFKWIFTCSALLRIANRGGKVDFYRVNPPQSGYACDTLQIARGKPA